MYEGNPYPTDEELDNLRAECNQWVDMDVWFDHVADMICGLWRWGECGYTRKPGILCLATGGWSGNESVLRAVDGTVWHGMFFLAEMSGGAVWYVDRKGGQRKRIGDQIQAVIDTAVLGDG